MMIVANEFFPFYILIAFYFFASKNYNSQIAARDMLALDTLIQHLVIINIIANCDVIAIVIGRFFLSYI